MKYRLQASLLIVAVYLVPRFCFAFFCPTNFNQIDYGMSVDQVIQQCGSPASQKESVKENENVPQEWTYFIQQTVSTGGSNPSPQGTLKTSVTFDDKGKAINISVNGIGVGASGICGSANIQLGDTRDRIKAACGDPVSVSKLTPLNNTAQPPPPPIKVIELNYSNGNPPTILVFENGKLMERK